jgi:hypothetical protein
LQPQLTQNAGFGFSVMMAVVKRHLGLFLLCGWTAWCCAGQDTAAPNFRTDRFSLKQARVVMVREPEATVAFNPQMERIQAMVNRGITFLCETNSAAVAWRSLVSTQDTIGIKVYSAPGPTSGTRPAVAAAVVNGLLQAGLPPDRIIVWDKHLADLRRAGYGDLAARFGIRLAGSADEGYDEKNYYETALLGQLVWGDFEFGRKGEGPGRKSFLSKLVTQQMTKIINLAPLLNHNRAGVAGHLWGLAMGSVDNTLRFEAEAERLATAIPEIWALPVVGDRVVLNVTDALICQYQGESRSLLHYSTALNQLWFSTDPVALDVLAIQELERQRQAANITSQKSNLELYQNAALLEIGRCHWRQIQVDSVP